MIKFIKGAIVALLGAVGLLYLVNPTAGILEVIPDNIPGIGNIDEGAAMTLVIMALAYFGLDVTKIFGRNSDGSAGSAPRRKGVVDINPEPPASS